MMPSHLLPTFCFTIVFVTFQSGLLASTCGDLRAEIVFILDSSGSIGTDNFQRMKTFIASFVDEIQEQIGSNGVRLAVIRYADVSSVMFNLGSCLVNTRFCVTSIQYTSGGTGTAKALAAARNQVFNNSRPNVRKIAVLVTDGQSDNKQMTESEGTNLKESGVDVVVIGIGSGVNHEELDAVATAKPYVFSVTFDSLGDIRTTFRGLLCWIGSQPDLNACRIKISSQQGEDTASYIPQGLRTHCINEQDNATNFQPVSVTFDVNVDVTISFENLPYYNSDNYQATLGVIGANISVVKLSGQSGGERRITSRYLNGGPYCDANVSRNRPSQGGKMLLCNGTLTLPNMRLNDGESLCAKVTADAGGYFTNMNTSSKSFFPTVTRTKKICFLYDESKPVHCFEDTGGCISQPLQLSRRLTRSPEIEVHVDGWRDPIPPGKTQSSASTIRLYRLEVHQVLVGTGSLSVEDKAVTEYNQMWIADELARGGPYKLTVTLPEEAAARLYAVILEVHDKAGNVNYARRLVLYDNTSIVQLTGAPIRVVSANPRSKQRWQTDITADLCVNWTGRFINNELYLNNFLMPVIRDTTRQIYRQYDQQSGILPITGTDNVNGVVKFEVSWSRDGFPRSALSKIPDVYSQRTCLRLPLRDGETYDVWIRASDIMGNFREDSAKVSIDHTPPDVQVLGLRGRFGRDGLYVHNTTDLSSMLLLVHAEDPHSGILTVHWALGTRGSSDDVGTGAVGVQRIGNNTNCARSEFCYCPSVGSCETYRYLLTFGRLRGTSSRHGQHHRNYHVTITVTNHAMLNATDAVEILVDESPPTVGVVLEGLSDDDRAEMDFTSSDVVHVRWHGFLDHESGILMYRVVLADRCLTNQEMNAANNATEVEHEQMVSFAFPSEGHYFVSVVAYNGAMEPSGVACSDGITYDTTPPVLTNVSISHARIGQAVYCKQPDEPWLVNDNMTRTRLANTNSCLGLCAQMLSVSSEHLPLDVDFALDNETSSKICETLPVRTEDSYIVLPSDYLRLTWAAVDAESEMEEYHVGMGRDRTTASAPDLLPFTPTHGHHSYHARHSGLGHGAVFFIFLRALSKAGLHVQLTLGPVIIDETPPDVNPPLTAIVEEDYLVVSWGHDTFTDPEQPEEVALSVTFRVGHEAAFVAPFLTVSDSLLAHCQGKNVTGCAVHPISALHAYDSESGRPFFFQLHVTNLAGHVTTVNTTSVRLPDHLAPSHAVVMDTIKPKSNLSSEMVVEETSSDFLTDVDVVSQREDICVAWDGFYHPEEVTIEVAIGTAPALDDVLAFQAAENRSPACVHATSFPVYTKLFSVVRATGSGGSSVFSSDGFTMIQNLDPENKLEVFNGRGCSLADVIGSHTINPSFDVEELEIKTNVALHAGDFLFIQLEPFLPDVSFPNAILLQTTRTGYQIVTSSSGLKLNLLGPSNTTTMVQIMNCLRDAPFLPASSSHFPITWDIHGPWANFVRYFKVSVFDDSCMVTNENETYARQHCILAEHHGPFSQRRFELTPESLVMGHGYYATVAVCFHDSCFPPSSSNIVVYERAERTVYFDTARILSQSAQQINVEFKAEIQPALIDRHYHSAEQIRCVFQWTVARARSASNPVTVWQVEESNSCAAMEKRATVNYTGAGQGSLYVCLQPVFPWRADNPTCHRLVRPGNINHVDPFHVIELPHTTLRQTDFGDYLHSHQLGSKLHELYDLDLDFARSDVLLSAVLTYSEGRNVTWFLMTNPHVPDDSNCAADASCVSTVSTHKGIVVFPRTDAILHEGTVYFVCARVSPRAGDLTDSELTSSKSSDVCGDGVVIDDTPPEGGKVEILNSNLGYLSGIRVMVTWSGFADVEEHVAELYDHLETLNYSVALGSYPGGQDIAEFVSVGQRTTWTFQHLNLTSGLYCTATVKAEDRVGHVTQAWSDLVLFDNTPPSVGYIAAGATSMERFVSGLQLPVHWGGVEDSESGITQLEVGVSTEGGSDDVPFHAVDGSAAVLNDSAELFDGHSYVALLKVTNGAGLITLKSSEPFIVDSSPPGPGVVFNSEPSTGDHRSYSSDVGVYRVYWTGFSDPHSGLDYYRVGLGSQPGHIDVHPFVYVGLRTSYTWERDFEQGEEYYVTVEACNKAGLCRVVSSSSMTFDNSPPTAGRVTIGFDRHGNRYVGHNTSLPVQWTGFSDPQTGIQDYFWCVGLSPEGCEVMPPVHNKLSQEAVTTGLTLPEATPLYVMVRARNPAGFEAVGVSASFSVDLTAPEVASKPRFVSPRDGSFVDSQWDRSVLRLEWLFRDAGSPVVSHTVNIRSKETGRPVTEPIQLASDTSWALILDADHLLLDGDSHWAAVTACNAAGLCTTEITDDILIDSTPPILGTFDFSLPWRKTSERQNGHSKTLVDLSWRHFSDAESGVAAYFVTVGRAYNGDDLSGGPVKVSHRKTTTIQRATLEVKEDLNPGDTVYATLWAENRLGLHSEMVRVAFDVLGENLSGTSGTLIAIRHSCETAYCTNECTCAPRGEVCDAPPNLCREHPDLSILTVVPQIVTSPGSENFTSSAKCLEGRWNLSGPFPLANISRFEWSFGLMNKPAGEGIFDMQTESPWRDIGRNMSAVHCMPGKRVLVSGQRYVLYVRAWLSRDEHLTFTSPPIIVDHLPPQIRRGRHVTDSDVSCNGDFDYVTFQSSVTACWAGVFRDFQSEIMRYEMWIGTSPHADDHSAITDVGLNTSVTFPTSTLEQGIHYYVTVRAVNGAGLTSTAVSDGVTVDVIPPVPGVVFAAYRHTHRPAQTSTTTLPASWYGFQDAHSGVMSYHVAVYDSNDHTTPLVPFTNVGTVTEYTLEGLDLQHNHSYEVAVKARDMAGLESDPVYSEAKLIDVTPPEGVTCTLFRLVEEKILLFQHTRSFHHESYKADISVEFPNKPRIFKVEVSASSMEREAGGYVSVQELKVPLYFTYGLSKNASAELLFMSPEMGNATVTVEVQAKAGAAVTAKFYRCGSVEPSSENSVAIRQMSHFEVSVVGFVRDEESGIKSLMFGVGTTPGGLQVQPLVPTHSGYALVNVQLQHGLPIYATVHAENHAGQWSRFISQPVTIDRTPPKVKNVHMSLRYEGESHDDVKQVWVESGWTAEDAESGVVSCTCHLQGGETTTDPVQNTGEVTSGFCEWQLRRPQHEMSVRVTVSCMNGVQIHTTAISDPAVVLFHPPDLSQTTVVSLSNNALLSPYDQSSFGVRSSNSSLEFCWLGLHDPTVAEVQYRFLHESRPLTEWSPVHTYKTSVVWGQHGNRLSTGNVTAQVRATNSRNMTSDTVSTTVRLDDHKPSLTGRSATATLRNGELLLNWTGVFSLNDDVTFAVYAGTAEGYGDLINHVVTKATAFRAPFTKTLPSMFLTVQAVYVNGHFEVYSAEMRL